MKILIAALTLRDVPDAIDYFYFYSKENKNEISDYLRDHFKATNPTARLSEYLKDHFKATNPTARTIWLLEQCESFIIERVDDPFNDSFGTKLADCEVLKYYGVIPDDDEKKIIEFIIRFGE